METLLSVENVVKGYAAQRGGSSREQVLALDGVSFSLPAGYGRAKRVRDRGDWDCGRH